MGILPQPEAEAVRSHLGQCAVCAREVAWLGQEQRLFERHAEAQMPPPLKMLALRRSVEAQLPERPVRRLWWRWRPGIPGAARALVTATAALMGAFFFASLPQLGSGGLALGGVGSSCVSMDSAAFCAAPSAPHELVAAVEDRFDACLVATPWLQPGGTDVCL